MRMTAAWILGGAICMYALTRKKSNDGGSVTTSTPGLSILDISKQLPQHPTKRYSSRSLSKINLIVVHHSSTNGGKAETFANHHINTHNWPGIGYHFVIGMDGTVFQTQSLTTRSYHAGNENTRGIGICLVGDFRTYQPKPEQLSNLKKLIKTLENKLGRSLELGTHRDFMDRTCPGKNFSLNLLNQYA